MNTTQTTLLRGFSTHFDEIRENYQKSTIKNRMEKNVI